MNQERCKGCNSLMQVEQVQFFESDGVTHLEKPFEIDKPYCRYHRLHLEFLERVYKGKEECPHYYDG